MRDNIKLHIQELFKRNSIENIELEEELTRVIEEKYDEYLEKTSNSITSFNKAISLIGDIHEIKETNQIVLNKESKEFSVEQKKKINKFSKYNLIICVIAFILISLIFGSWTTSWIILILSFFIDIIYKLYISKDIINKKIRYVFSSIFIILSIFSLLIIGVGIRLSFYDYSFELNEKTLRKEVVINTQYNNFNITTIRADIFVENHDGNDIIIKQYSKVDLSKKYLYSYKIDDNNTIEIKEEKTASFIFGKYYHSVYKVLIPKDLKIENFNFYGISSDFKINIQNNLENINLESTSGSIEISSINISNEATFKTLKGKLDLNSSNINNLSASSSSGLIKFNKLTSKNINLSSMSGLMDLTDITSDNLLISNDKGSLKAENITSTLKVIVKQGNVLINNLKLLAKSEINTQRGNIELKFAKQQEYKLSYNSNKGYIDNDYLSNKDGIELFINSETGNIKIGIIEKDQ